MFSVNLRFPSSTRTQDNAGNFAIAIRPDRFSIFLIRRDIFLKPAAIKNIRHTDLDP